MKKGYREPTNVRFSVTFFMDIANDKFWEDGAFLESLLLQPFHRQLSPMGGVRDVFMTIAAVIESLAVSASREGM